MDQTTPAAPGSLPAIGLEAEFKVHVDGQEVTPEELDARPELVKTMSVQPPRGGGMPGSPNSACSAATCSGGCPGSGS